MGTRWSVQIAQAPQPPPLQLADQIQTTLDHLDRQVFSTYSASSEISRLNSSTSGEPVSISSELMDVLQLAATINSASNGAFDITVGELVNLWGFGPQPGGEPPSDSVIHAAIKRKGMAKLQLDLNESTVIKTGDFALDLSGIAKGYAVDVTAKLLEASGVEHYLVEIGGEIRVKGHRNPQQAWQIAIESPTEYVREAWFSLTNNGAPMALAGSGDYRNFREIDGKRFSHEIDPVTGRPVTHKLAAVTVVADTAASADAWATALMVQGESRGLQTANSLGLQAYFIIHDDQALEARSSNSFLERFKP